MTGRMTVNDTEENIRRGLITVLEFAVAVYRSVSMKLYGQAGADLIVLEQQLDKLFSPTPDMPADSDEGSERGSTEYLVLKAASVQLILVLRRIKQLAKYLVRPCSGGADEHALTLVLEVVELIAITALNDGVEFDPALFGSGTLGGAAVIGGPPPGGQRGGGILLMRHDAIGPRNSPGLLVLVHQPANERELDGPEGQRQIARMLRKAFPQVIAPPQSMIKRRRKIRKPRPNLPRKHSRKKQLRRQNRLAKDRVGRGTAGRWPQEWRGRIC